MEEVKSSWSGGGGGGAGYKSQTLFWEGLCFAGVPKGSAALHPSGVLAVGLGASQMTPEAVADVSCPSQHPAWVPRDAHPHGPYSAACLSPSLCPPLAVSGLSDGDIRWMLSQQTMLGSAWV